MNPVLDYDLAFHSGYEITIPLHALAGSGGTLTAILRVTPEGGEEPSYFSQKWAVPPLEESVKGDTSMHGTFVLGEGNYQIGWLMRDGTERFCTAFWKVSALRRGKDRAVRLHIAPGTVQPTTREPFREEEPAQRDTERPLSVLVLLHVAPQAIGGTEMQATETQTMVSILRNIARERRFARFSITAFNIDQHAVIFRQTNAPKIEFPALGRAVNELHLGTVSVQILGGKDGGTRFLVGLFAEELARERPDVLMIVGPKSAPDEGSLRNLLKQLPDPACPVFYLNYRADELTNRWRDLLGSVVKVWNGVEYSISKPSDLFFSWAGVVSRLTASPTKQASAATGLR
jgi:hypothetical protein